MSNHKKILLVDDDKDDQLFFIDAINEIEPEVECIVANNGLEAIVHLNSIAPLPTLIFLDLNMPFMNGFECLSEIKKAEKFKSIPVVIFTTTNHPIDQDRMRSMGAKLFLTKPPDFRVLKTKLDAILHTDFDESL
ncbi:MAG: response regulator [Bacteroidota bacterium]|nr:response regulator [Bacteroidota bacterium]